MILKLKPLVNFPILCTLQSLENVLKYRPKSWTIQNSSFASFLFSHSPSTSHKQTALLSSWKDETGPLRVPCTLRENLWVKIQRQHVYILLNYSFWKSSWNCKERRWLQMEILISITGLFSFIDLQKIIVFSTKKKKTPKLFILFSPIFEGKK